jgi:hypothetical protein
MEHIMATKKEKKEIKVQGVITPAAWNDDDEITSISIVTWDDDEYLIEPSEIEEELLEYIDQEMELVGVAREENDELMLNVKSFKELSEDDEDDFDDDYDGNDDDDDL